MEEDVKQAKEAKDAKEAREAEEESANLARIHAAANPNAYMGGNWNPRRLEADRQGNLKPAAGSDDDGLLAHVQRAARGIRALSPEARAPYLDAFLRLIYGDRK